jgi:hypothetical protein
MAERPCIKKNQKGIIRGRTNHQFLSEKSWEQVIRLLRELNNEE